MSVSILRQTRDIHLIRAWTEARQGRPVQRTNGAHQAAPTPGSLRLEFGEKRRRGCAPLDWETFFEVFEKSDLVFSYEDGEPDAGGGGYCRLVLPSVR